MFRCIKAPLFERMSRFCLKLSKAHLCFETAGAERFLTVDLHNQVCSPALVESKEPRDHAGGSCIQPTWHGARRAELRQAGALCKIRNCRGVCVQAAACSHSCLRYLADFIRQNVPGFDEVVLGCKKPCGLHVLVLLDVHRSTLSCALPTVEA